MAKYKFVNEEGTIVLNTENNANIPVNSSGWHVDDYNEWVAQGGIPDPYEPPIVIEEPVDEYSGIPVDQLTDRELALIVLKRTKQIDDQDKIK